MLAQTKALIADGGTGVRDLVGVTFPNAVPSSALSSRHDPAVDPAAR
jgi:hypothetical protein